MSLDQLIKVPKILFLDFDGVFTNNFVYIDSKGCESLKLSKYDSYGISRLKDAGVKIHVISSDANGKIISQRCKKMSISFSYNVKDKVEEATQFIESAIDSLENCAFIGNDLNDAGLLGIIGIPIIVNDAHPDLLKYGYLRTKCNGGNGAIREVADKIISIIEEKNESSDI